MTLLFRIFDFSGRHLRLGDTSFLSVLTRSLNKPRTLQTLTLVGLCKNDCDFKVCGLRAKIPIRG